MNDFDRYDSVNQKKQQIINRSLVINLLRQERLCSRADLSKLSGLKRATITYIVNEFMEYDLVVEDGLLHANKGRRSIGLRINGEKYRTLGVMITRNYYSLGMMGLSGEVFYTETHEVQREMPGECILSEIKANIIRMCELETNSRVLAICVAVPGPYKKEGDHLAFVTNLLGWENIKIHEILQEGLDIPVFVENDANAGVCAQQWFRKKKSDQKDIVYIVAGQGIGCGIIMNGELQHGSMGGAGELGHTSINFMGPKCECGNHGCLENYCSSIALLKKVKERIAAGDASVLTQDADFAAFSKAVKDGDALAVEEFKTACECLAVGIINLVNQMNPSDVIIGDILSEVHPEMMLEIIRKKVIESLPPFVSNSLIIECDQLEYNPILLGAGAIAAQNVLENPISYMKQA